MGCRTQFLKLAIQFAISVVLARILTPDDFGLMVVAMIFIGFANIPSEGEIASAVVQKTGIDYESIPQEWTYEPKYPKATACLQKDREELLTFYALPARHWQSLRTTNPIESTFGTTRH